MAKPDTSRAIVDQLASGAGIAGLEQSVRKLAGGGHWALNARLPTTRILGERFGISNASVSRLLQRLDREGVIWRRPNGRYYSAASHRLFARPKTFACLLRKLENWSRVYFGVMSGFSREFGANQAAMLFVHNETLVRHSDTAHPPAHAGAAMQTAALEAFLSAPHESVAGVLLDDVWRDDVLAKFAGRLGAAVVVCRPTSLPEISSVSIDFAAAGLSAIAHLYARGYEEIVIAVPFTNAAPISLMISAAKKGAATLGKAIPAGNVCLASTPAARARLVARLCKSKKRVGIFCPEDNVALQLHQELVAAGGKVPASIGLLSGMGTDLVTRAGISSLRIDYEAIGRLAAEILTGPEPRQVVLSATLAIAGTT
ncbi:MAG TPA: substrate-binding domain-containing protein [Opitutaceae bacterium]|nr:substrate-binding domain-containing protein [Opitutaceae bacterium]